MGRSRHLEKKDSEKKGLLGKAGRLSRDKPSKQQTSSKCLTFADSLWETPRGIPQIGFDEVLWFEGKSQHVIGF